MGYGECGNGRREGGGPDNVIPHAALQIFNNCCCYFVFFRRFFHCFLFDFSLFFYLASMIVTLGIEGLKILFHMLFSRFQQFVIVVF